MIFRVTGARRLYLALLLLVASAATAAEPQAVPEIPVNDSVLTDAQKEEIRGAFRRGIERGFIPGGNLALIYRGEVVFREGFGEADIKAGRPFTVDLPCRIASLTKPHTATVLAILADQGKLSLDDTVDRYLPEFAMMKVEGQETTARAPTVAECLSHTAGFPGNDVLKAGESDLDMDGDLAEVVKRLAKEELVASPGTRYAYSRLGYMTAGRLAEVIVGKPFPEIMDETLLEPIGASETRFFIDGDALPEEMPVPYDRTANGFEERTGERLGTAINPGGSLIATLDGVSRLVLLHRNGGKIGEERLVSEEALQAMYVPRPATPGSGYGLGFNLMAKRPDGMARLIRHTGAAGTYASFDFEKDLIVVILTQVPQRQTDRWRQGLLRTIDDVTANFRAR